MTKLDPHPFSLMFPPITEEDFDKLVADIKANGLHQHIVRYQGKILDGNNRYRACAEAGIEPTFADFTGIDADAKTFVISMNINRRHLSPEQRREIIAAVLKADPSQSNRQVAKTTKSSHHTVEAEREKLEATGQIAQLTATTGADDKKRKRKAKGKGSGSGKTSITYQQVVNAKTALNAYSVLEGHLLDALQDDIGKHCDFSQVEDCARGTIEKLEEKLGEMQPEEEEVAA